MNKNKEMLEIIEKEISIDKNGISEWFSLEELNKKYPQYEFITTNGGSWRRKNTPINNKYIIETLKNKNKVTHLKFSGFNKKIENHSIPLTVIKEMKKKPNIDHYVSICDDEIDHKNGKYSNENYDINDFQKLSKSGNDAKRQHCIECKKTGLRFCATKLGFSYDFIEGDIFSKKCEGCYWNDIEKFRKEISKNFIVKSH